MVGGEGSFGTTLKLYLEGHLGGSQSQWEAGIPGREYCLYKGLVGQILPTREAGREVRAECGRSWKGRDGGT
jgi:hypothetical protein